MQHMAQIKHSSTKTNQVRKSYRHNNNIGKETPNMCCYETRSQHGYHAPGLLCRLITAIKPSREKEYRCESKTKAD
jgi:hypothetical protein